MRTRRLYLDLDGVLADFDGYFETLFGLHPAKFCLRHGDDAMWARINGVDRFFANLPACDGALRAFGALFPSLRERLAILTACPHSNYASVATQKRDWCRQHLGNEVTVLPVRGATTKPYFMHAPGDVLVDDFEKNTKAWEAAGGVAILHTGDWVATLDNLLETLWSE